MSEDFYSRVQRRIWTDARFRKLSKPAPNARDLFLYLLTTPSATQVPGLIALGESAMAEDLEWPVAGLRKCLAELEQAGMVKVDRVARLLWMPNALKHNQPRSSDNVRGWAKFWRMLPECPLLTEAAGAIMAEFVTRGGAFPQAFALVSGEPIPDQREGAKEHPKDDPKDDPKGPPLAGPKPAPTPAPQYQYQDQDQDQQKDQKNSHTSAGARVREDDVQDEDRPSEPGSVATATTETLLAAVGRHDMLATLHEDKRWAMRLAGVFIASGVRAPDVDAAVDAFVADNAAKAPDAGPALDEFVREGVGRYLKNAKQYGDTARQRAARGSDRGCANGAPAAASDVRAVLAVFADVWTARKKQPFAQATGDEKHAATIVTRAWEEAGKLKIRPSEVVRHWATQHLKSADKWVVESNHALATMGARLTDYGLPSAKPAAAPKPPREPEPPASPCPPELLAQLKAPGSALKDGPPANLRRPST